MNMEDPLQANQFIWHTRGKYWDYEFVCLPKNVEEYAYSLMKKIMRSCSSQEYPVHFSGTLKGQRFIGILTRDETLCDHASRPIEHLAIWFRPEDAPLSWDKIPADWFDQFYAKTQDKFNTDRFYRMTDDAVRSLWQKEIPLGRVLREEMLKDFEPVSIQGGPLPASWHDLGEVASKKNADPPIAKDTLALVLVSIGIIALVAWFVWGKK
jgi:hypothetical protein